MFHSTLEHGFYPILDSIEVSIPACHAGDPGSIPGRGGTFTQGSNSGRGVIYAGFNSGREDDLRLVFFYVLSMIMILESVM